MRTLTASFLFLALAPLAPGQQARPQPTQHAIIRGYTPPATMTKTNIEISLRTLGWRQRDLLGQYRNYLILQELRAIRDEQLRLQLLLQQIAYRPRPSPFSLDLQIGMGGYSGGYSGGYLGLGGGGMIASPLPACPDCPTPLPAAGYPGLGTPRGGITPLPGGLDGGYPSPAYPAPAQPSPAYPSPGVGLPLAGGPQVGNPPAPGGFMDYSRGQGLPATSRALYRGR